MDRGSLSFPAIARAVALEAPFEDGELVVLGASLIALLYALFSLRGPDRPAGAGLCIAALSCLCTGLLATNFENLARDGAATMLNLVEHAAYLAHTTLLCAYLLARRHREAE